MGYSIAKLAFTRAILSGFSFRDSCYRAYMKCPLDDFDRLHKFIAVYHGHADDSVNMRMCLSDRGRG